jgi:hypothetical protein
MIDNMLYFLKTQLSFGNAWQNIIMYSMLVLLAKVITIQHSLIRIRHKADNLPIDNDTKGSKHPFL